ncbi:SDR family NAD(P)-dependent oxidoreductase [Streptomyces sp. Y7]|uniref:SDR family NAD(P)-dependent oxidoreductase n=1 Tax=Streptomyces sp. Y7 TaxID=3342392 RepID=UPI00371D43ED
MSTALPVPVSSPLTSALAGTTAVLVGGSSGIGLAAGVLLRSVGARVVLVGRDPDRLKTAVDQVRDACADGDSEDAVLGIASDAADEKTLTEAFDAAGRVDHVLLTASGRTGTLPMSEMSADDLRTTVDARLWPAFAVARLAATRLPAGGSLTLTSGMLMARPQPGTAARVATLGAVEALTRGLAVELAPARQRVNAIRYGRIDTPLLRSAPGHDSDDAVATVGSAVPLGRVGTAQEAAAGALFLMANNYITGQILTLDGGETLR